MFSNFSNSKQAKTPTKANFIKRQGKQSSKQSVKGKFAISILKAQNCTKTLSNHS
jgi:hypothetical protein